MIVMKFGGSSLATVDNVLRAIGIVRGEIDRKPVIVVSAHGKTTDRLIEAAHQALDGTVAIREIEEFHYGLIEELGLDRRVVEPLIHNLSTLLHGVSLLRELTERTLDHIMSFGERMSTRIIAAAMAGEGVPAAAVNSFEIGLVTNSDHGRAVPLQGIEDDIGKELRKFNLVPVVTGFLGSDKKGNITTLGRSGSDFSASIVGAAIDAEEVQIWTDVNGVMTCDPSIDSNAENLPLLSFDEASELAYYGAKVLHQNTLMPAIRKKIPVRVLNTLEPENPGTKIVAESVRTDRIAKSVVYKENVCLINLASPRLMSAVNLLSSALKVLSSHQVGIHMAATSEATVSMVTDRHYEGEQLDKALRELKEFGDVTIETEKTIVCVVGKELKGQAGVLGAIFGAVSAKGIKAKMVSQSASEINVAFLVDNSQIESTVCALHKLLTR
ncbi:MAG: aspartate kinase [Proteobacteria bacterium]|nr:aspartate kinase [Pseudomonadota bacterium]